MNTPTISYRHIPVVMLLTAGLLSLTACGGSSRHHPSHGMSSGYAYAHSGKYKKHGGNYDAGTARHGGHHDGKHGKHGGGRHDGTYKKHGGGHAMHGSGHRASHARGRGGHQGAVRFIDHVLKFQDGMSLTDEQVRRLYAIRTQHKKDRIVMKADIKLGNVDLHELLRTNTASLSDIEAQLNAIHAVKTKLYLASIKAKRAAVAVLSKEQRARMNAIHKRIKARGGMAHHNGAGHKKHRERQHGESEKK